MLIELHPNTIPEDLKKYFKPKRKYGPFLCRNKIIWHKNNVMPSSASDRFTIDYEMLYFFVKSKNYYFEQQFEPIKTETIQRNKYGWDGEKKVGAYSSKRNAGSFATRISKYESLKQESSVRQGMNKDRGNNLIEKRDLPPQKEFVDKLRKNFNVDELVNKGLKRTTVEHWFRYDESGFAYPSKEEWKKVNTDLFPELLDVYYETDDVRFSKVPYSVQPRDKDFIEYRDLPDIKELSKRLNDERKRLNFTIEEIESKMNSQAPHHWFNAESYPSVDDWNKLKEFGFELSEFDKQMTEVYTKSSEKKNVIEFGRNKRCVWNINTKPSKIKHFALYPEKLCETPIKSTCPIGGIVLDPFFGGGTTGISALKLGRKFIGIELNPEYIKIAENRLKPYLEQEKL